VVDQILHYIPQGLELEPVVHDADMIHELAIDHKNEEPRLSAQHFGMRRHFRVFTLFGNC
jgi:hypothetical protein